MKWLVEDASFGLFTFTELTRSIAWVLEQPYDLARALLVNGFVQGVGAEAVQWLPPLSWIAVVFVVAAIGHYAKSIGLAVFVGLCRSEEHTSELQSLMRISYAVFCLKKKKTITRHKNS